MTVIYANGTRETYLLNSKRQIPFNPPLKSIDEANERINAMAADEIGGSAGRSDITIKAYRWPQGITNWIIIGWGTLMMVGIFVRNMFAPGSGLYKTLGVDPNADAAKWCYRIVFFLSMLTLVVHILEASIILAPKLYKYNVPFGSGLWWKWYLGHIVGGMTSSWTLDEIVKEEEKRQKKA
ncbi:hypothetical protein AOQ84DRAFT_290443 [Glonium stellatum]|uniref:Uncharacterized protein n=1 Tax=Glonium stellatum TaxID=574774 RepID=A0A8E2F3E1_9PEZI|nr:hypothetical protein AOQ84DRAFT_290443 [Glonium stellatum]